MNHQESSTKYSQEQDAIPGSGSTYVLDFFIAETYGYDEKAQIDAISHLEDVAIAIGPEATRTSLIPFLKNYVERSTYHEEVQLHLARKLRTLVSYLGNEEHSVLLIDILATLASNDDPRVGEEATESLRYVAQFLESDVLEKRYIELIYSLMEYDWFVTKCAALSLFKVCYPKVKEETKTELRKRFLVMCFDDSPMVRRAAASNFKEILDVIEIEHITNDFLPNFSNMAKDDQDSVRQIIVDISIKLALILQRDQIETLILPTILGLARDSSWKVRQEVANKILEIQEVLGQRLTKTHLISIVRHLSLEGEPSIRLIIASKIIQFIIKIQTSTTGGTLDPTIELEIMPIVNLLIEDPNENIRDALSKDLTKLCNVFGVENTKTYLLPAILTGINNSALTNVKENYIENLNDVVDAIGYQNIAHLIENIMKEIIEKSSSLWRTRRKLIITIKMLIKYVNVNYFTEHILSLYHKLLSDPVYTIRKLAPLILPILIKTYGMLWAKQCILNSIFNYAKHSHYLYRYITLFCIDEIVDPTLETKTVCFLNKLETNLNKKLLFKITYLNKLLKEKLNENWITISLETDYYQTNEDSSFDLYSEGVFDDLKEDDIEILEINDDEIGKDKSYIEELLLLLLRYILNIIKKLTSDEVDNVKGRANISLAKIVNLQKQLDDELKSNWISDILKTITDQEKLEMISALDKELITEEIFLKVTMNEDHGTELKKTNIQNISPEITKFVGQNAINFKESDFIAAFTNLDIRNGRQSDEMSSKCGIHIDKALSVTKENLLDIDGSNKKKDEQEPSV